MVGSEVVDSEVAWVVRSECEVAGVFSQSQLPAVHLKASWVGVMYTMNNHTTQCNSVTAGLTKHCI